MPDPTQVPAWAASLQADLLRPAYGTYLQHLLEMTHELASHGSGKEAMDHYHIKLTDTVDPGVGRWLARSLSDQLNVTKLFHCSSHMAALAAAAATHLDFEKDRWAEDDMPSRNGLLMFQQPLILMDVWNRPVNVAALLWQWDPKGMEGPVGASDPTAHGVPGWSWILFSDSRDVRDWYLQPEQQYPDSVPARSQLSALGRLAPLSMNYMPVGLSVGWVPDNRTADENYRRENPGLAPRGNLPPWDPAGPPTIANLSGINYAIFQLMRQTLADVSEWADRRLARRHRGKKRPPHMVTVIKLRRPAREESGEGSGYVMTYQQIVDGHWKRVHFKDPETGEDRVRRQYITPYWRGDPNGPIRQTKRVTTLQR
jgi:hypothetical protein